MLLKTPAIRAQSIMLASAARGDPSRLVQLGAGDGEAFGGQEGNDSHNFLKNVRAHSQGL